MIAPPYLKTQQPQYAMHIDGTGPRSQTFLGIDSLIVVGPYYDAEGAIDLNSIMALRVPSGVSMYTPDMMQMAITANETQDAKFVNLEASG